MDNVTQNTAPIIPAGTEKSVYGTASFVGNRPFAGSSPVPGAEGQAGVMPNSGKSESAEYVTQQSGDSSALQGTTFDELAAKKGFKSADDLAAAYSNLESQNKRVEMSLSELVDSRTKSQPAEDVSVEELQNAQSQEQALKIVEKVVKKFTKPLEDKLALQDLFAKNTDAQQYAGEMAKLVKENPGISWDVAYKAAKFDRLGTQAREEGKRQAYQEINRKQILTTESPRSAIKENKPLLDLIKDKNIPFHEVQRLMKTRFSQ